MANEALLEDASARHRAGDLAAAEPVYRRVLAEAPGHPEALFLLGILCLQSGRGAEAERLLGAAVEAAPANAKAWNALGVLRHRQGDLGGAEGALRAAAAADPALADARHNLARVLREAGTRLDEAEALLRALPPGPMVANDLGCVLQAAKRDDAAEAAFRQALDWAPAMPEPARNLASLFKAQGRAAEAWAMAPAAADPLTRFNLAVTTPAIPADDAAIDEAFARSWAALAVAPELTVDDPLAAFGAMGHFFLAYADRPLRAIHQAAAAAVRRMCPGLAFTAPHCKRPPVRRRRLRVAFVSAHFHGHTIARLCGGLIASLPRDRFEVVVAAAGRRDDTTAQLAAAADRFLVLPPRLDVARRMLAEVEADIVFFPDIGMEPFTYYLAFARLAPVQVTTWGHPVTTGIDTLDIFLSADWLEPAGAEDEYSERLHRLRHPAFHFKRPPVVRRDRAHFGLPEAGRLYVCPQSPFKLHPAFDRLLARILADDPGGRVLLLAGRPHWQAALAARFAHTMPEAAGRVSFLPAMPREDFLGLLGLADVMLDIPSFAGGNTTLEGLAAGTPVVTLPSRFARGRFTGAILDTAGLHQGIAADADAYCRLAVETACDGGAYRRAIAAQAPALYERRAAVDELADFLEQAAESR